MAGLTLALVLHLWRWANALHTTLKPRGCIHKSPQLFWQLRLVKAFHLARTNSIHCLSCSCVRDCWQWVCTYVLNSYAAEAIGRLSIMTLSFMQSSFSDTHINQHAVKLLLRYCQVSTKKAQCSHDDPKQTIVLVFTLKVFCDDLANAKPIDDAWSYWWIVGE